LNYDVISTPFGRVIEIALFRFTHFVLPTTSSSKLDLNFKNFEILV